MRYEITDECGDKIVVAPAKRDPTSPMVVIQFNELEDGEVKIAAMKLDQRKATDLKQAINRALRESERTG